MAEILSGGLNWGSTQQAIVTMDKEGHPLSCCNPVTGECLGGGGGSSDFSTATLSITNNSNEHVAIVVPYVLERDSSVYSNGLISIPTNTEKNVEVIIPNNSICIGLLYKHVGGDLLQNISGLTIGTNGDIEYEEGEMFISGDCAITINAEA